MYKINNEQNRTRDVETGNRLTAARGKGAEQNGGKKGEGLLKEHM